MNNLELLGFMTAFVLVIVGFLGTVFCVIYTFVSLTGGDESEETEEKLDGTE